MSYDMHTRVGWSDTKGDMARMFATWRVREWEISCPSRAYDSPNLPRENKAVTVRYRHPKTGQFTEITIDRFTRPVDNQRAIFLGLDAIRLNEARGLGEVAEQFYAGLLAAPVRERDPYEILGIRPDASLDVAEAVYKMLAKTAHPDAGGSTERMTELNAAIEKVRAR